MTSSSRRFGIALAFFGISATLPATVGAQQPPIYLTQWGTYGTGPGEFIYPFGAATDAAGNVYVVDTNNARIQKFTAGGSFLTQWGSPGNGNGQFDIPAYAAVDASGNVFVTDLNNSRIQKFTSTGVYLTQWGSAGSGIGQFNGIVGVATDSAGNVYVSEVFNHRIQKFTGNGAYLTQWGTFGSGDGQFYYPYGVAVDQVGNVFVADFSNQRIQKFTGNGTYLTQWGSYGSGDGQFQDPVGVATDRAGNVYVSEFSGNRIQEFSGTGAYLTQWGSFGSGDGQFYGPAGLATDAAFNIFVVDDNNHRVQKFGPASPPPPPTCPVTVAFDFKPNTLNLRSMGRWISGHIEPPAPYSPSDIDVASILLNGTVPVDPAAPVAIGDGNGNGTLDLKVKFDRAAVQATVVEGDSVPVELRGDIGEECFQGGDVARMIHAPVTAPDSGRVVAFGQPTPIRWQTPPGAAPRWVAALTSFDGGQNWDLVTDHLPNNGFYEWQAPYVTVTDARVAVVLVEEELGEDEVEGVLGIGPSFSIGSTTGVGPMGSAFALHGATPHPARGRIRLSISLPDAEPAMIAVYDLAGRRAWAKDIGALGPGRHVIDVTGSATLPAGVYLARLSRPGQVLERRVVLVP